MPLLKERKVGLIEPPKAMPCGYTIGYKIQL
jgi:hypothetical protein